MALQAAVINHDEFAQMVDAALRRQSSGLSEIASTDGHAPKGLTGASSAFSEAYRMLALSIARLDETRPMRTIIVMGAYPGDGRTTTVANLGIALAELGKRVLVVESDARAPQLASFLGVPSQPQAVPRNALSVLATRFDGLLLVRPVWAANDSPPPEPRLMAKLLKRGRAKGDGDEQLVLPALRTVRAFVESRSCHGSPSDSVADFVILDSPPCLRYSDAFFLARETDGVLYVVRRRRQDVQAQRAIQAQLRTIGANIIGAVYNEA